VSARRSKSFVLTLCLVILMGKLSKVKGVKNLGDVDEEFDAEALRKSLEEAFEAAKRHFAECADKREKEKQDLIDKYGDMEIR